MAPDGSDLRDVMAGYVDQLRSPRWSWQGDRIAAISVNPADGFATIVPPTAGDHVHLHPPDPSLTLLCSAWAPDGTKIACEGFDSSKPSRSGIYTVSAVDGSNLTQITTAGGTFRDVPGDYGPDGRIAFVRTTYDVLGLGEIWIANGDGTNAHKVTDTLSTYHIAWSRDGRWIAGERAGVLEVFDLQDLTADPVRVKVPGGTATDPRFSPDSSRIIFVFRKTGARTTSIETVKLDGTGVVKITSGSLDRSPDWGTPGF